MTRFAAAALAWLVAASGQQVFRTTTDAVHVDVLVTDGNRPVTGLTADDFELRDNGVVQKVTSTVIADIPIALLLALDTSTSVEGSTLDHLKAGALAALTNIDARDRAAVLTFSSSLSLKAPWGTPPADLSAAISSARAGGSTSLYDAAFTALILRDETVGYRNLVVVFSDGEDTASWLPAAAVLDKARRADSVVYAVVLSEMPPGRTSPAHNAGEGRLYHRSGIDLSPPQTRSAMFSTPFIQELTEITGGTMFQTERTSELRGAFARILTEFRSRYLLTYTPAGVDTPGWHAIDVKVKSGRGRVRARRGYTR